MSSGPPAKRLRQITLASSLQLSESERSGRERDMRARGKGDTVP